MHGASISGAIPEGSIEVISAEDPRDIRLRLLEDDEHSVMFYYHLRAIGVRGRECRFTIINAHEKCCHAAAGRSDDEHCWNTPGAMASYDLQDWFRVPGKCEDGTYAFAHTSEHDVFITRHGPRAFGAEISNVDLRRPLPAKVLPKVRAALIQYKVIFFRDQDITSEQQVAFARQFGEIQDYPVFRSSENPAMQDLKSKYARADIWHTDLAWLERPPFAAVLCAKVIPYVGGDTMWADGERVYENLPDELKSQIDELYLVHDSSRIGAHYVSGEERERRLARVRELRKQHPMIAHPIAPTYPESGRRYLYVNPALAESIVGLSRDESRQLLDRLQAAYLRPEKTLRFRWSTNAIAMWDERRTLHYGVYDYGDE